MVLNIILYFDEDIINKQQKKLIKMYVIFYKYMYRDENKNYVIGYVEVKFGQEKIVELCKFIFEGKSG